MVTFILVLHIIVTVFLVGIILIQKNEGGGLGVGSGNMGGMMSARGTANFLTRTTAVLATIFFVSTLGLAIYFKGGSKDKSILQETDVNAVSLPLIPEGDVKGGAPVSGAPSPVGQ